MVSTQYNVTRVLVLLLATVVFALPLAVNAHGKHPGPAKRSGECTKPSQQTVRIGRHTMGFAVERFKLQGIASQEDFQRGGEHMNNFLRWKLGGAAAVCAQYVTGGYGHFEKAYSDEAAAMALGILYFSRQEPELSLPNWFIAYLNFTYDMTSLGATGVVLDKIGLGGLPSVNTLRAHLYEQTVKPVFDAVVAVAAYLPKSFDIDNRYVHEAIAARKYSAMGISVMRRNWSGKAPSRSGRSRDSVLIPQFGEKPSRSNDTGTGVERQPRAPDMGYEPPDTGGYNDPGAESFGCPGNQMMLPDGSCGCGYGEALDGDNCIALGGESDGLPFVEEQPLQYEAYEEELPGYQESAPGWDGEQRIQGEMPYYEQ